MRRILRPSRASVIVQTRPRGCRAGASERASGSSVERGLCVLPLLLLSLSVRRSQPLTPTSRLSPLARSRKRLGAQQEETSQVRQRRRPRLRSHPSPPSPPRPRSSSSRRPPAPPPRNAHLGRSRSALIEAPSIPGSGKGTPPSSSRGCAPPPPLRSLVQLDLRRQLSTRRASFFVLLAPVSALAPPPRLAPAPPRPAQRPDPRPPPRARPHHHHRLLAAPHLAHHAVQARRVPRPRHVLRPQPGPGLVRAGDARQLAAVERAQAGLARPRLHPRRCVPLPALPRSLECPSLTREPSLTLAAGSNLTSWRAQIGDARLSNSFNLVAVDCRFHGFTKGGERTSHTLENSAECVMATLVRYPFLALALSLSPARRGRAGQR